MFCIKEPFIRNLPWNLSHCKETKIASIPVSTIKQIRNYHILGIDFLYQSYKKQFKGAILNEAEGMNMQLQVATFLNAILNYVEPKFLVLIITPDRHIVNWHYHLTTHGGLKVQIITPKTCPEDFDQEHGLALLLSFSNLKLSEYLVDYDYSSVVIDEFDEVASKLVIRKLHGFFNIGLTQRNFYTHPDQKLQWSMLNWSNPGCVGKLGDFYQVDNDNFANFRDNYRHWWFRLTWNFCESFKEPTDEEKRDYMKTLSTWTMSNHLTNYRKPMKRTAKKRKIVDEDKKPTETDEKMGETNHSKSNKIEGDIQHVIKVENSTPVEEESEQTKNLVENESQSSDTTIIYELDKERDPNYVELPSMDENPILNSIIRNLEKSPEAILSQHSTFTYSPVKYNIEEPNCSKVFEEEEDILLSIIDDKIPKSMVVDEETELNFKKEEIRSQIFSEEPCTSKSFTQEENSDFFQSLIDSDAPVREKQSDGLPKRSKSDIETILRETEVLLK